MPSTARGISTRKWEINVIHTHHWRLGRCTVLVKKYDLVYFVLRKLWSKNFSNFEYVGHLEVSRRCPTAFLSYAINWAWFSQIALYHCLSSVVKLIHQNIFPNDVLVCSLKSRTTWTRYIGAKCSRDQFWIPNITLPGSNRSLETTTKTWCITWFCMNANLTMIWKNGKCFRKKKDDFAITMYHLNGRSVWHPWWHGVWVRKVRQFFSECNVLKLFWISY